MEAPSDYKNAGLANLIGGAFNAMWSLGVVLSLIWFCVGVFWLVPLGLSAWQAVVGLNMFNGQPNASSKTATIAGIVSGVLNINPISVVCGIYAYMMLGKPEVAGFLEQR